MKSYVSVRSAWLHTVSPPSLHVHQSNFWLDGNDRIKATENMQSEHELRSLPAGPISYTMCVSREIAEGKSLWNC